MKFFNKYTKQNCIQECLSNTTLEICGCVKYFQIRDQNSNFCSKRAENTCFDKVSSVISDINSEAFKSCDCLPSCNYIDFKFELFFENSIEPRRKENITSSSLSIYFSEDEFLVFKRFTSFGAVTLVSNIGGLLALFLGVSLLSAVELFYYFVIRFINNLWWNESVKI